MASFYETPSIDEQSTFPPAKKANPPQSPAQKLEFESSIKDSRVRREQESQASSIASINVSINKRVEEIAAEFNQSNVDLDDVKSVKKQKQNYINVRRKKRYVTQIQKNTEKKQNHQKQHI